MGNATNSTSGLIAKPEAFTEADRYGYAGANNFPNGDPPFTLSTFADDTEVEIVCSADDGETVAEFQEDIGERVFRINLPTCQSSMEAAFALAVRLQFGFREGSIRTNILTRAGLGKWL